jgi:hypothetical protein
MVFNRAMSRRGILELSRRPLEAKVEAFLLELEDFVVDLVERERTDFGGFHGSLTPRCAGRNGS